MKLLTKIIPVILCCVFLLMITACKKDPVFGNDRAVSGIMKDQAGNIVAGDITTTDFIVKALGAGDVVTTDMRVMGDGTFQNTKLYGKKYKIWVTGPVTTTEDTLTVDLAANTAIIHDFVVIPFVTIDLPVAGENPTATTIDIHYGMTAQSGKTISKRELYCSTNPFPNAIIGTGAFYTTTKVVLPADSGTATITGLVTNTKYYIRIGTQTTGSPGFNYSEQIVVKTL
jgi:hypothetical protein